MLAACVEMDQGGSLPLWFLLNFCRLASASRVILARPPAEETCGNIQQEDLKGLEVWTEEAGPCQPDCFCTAGTRKHNAKNAAPGPVAPKLFVPIGGFTPASLPWHAPGEGMRSQNPGQLRTLSLISVFFQAEFSTPADTPDVASKVRRMWLFIRRRRFLSGGAVGSKLSLSHSRAGQARSATRAVNLEQVGWPSIGALSCV